MRVGSSYCAKVARTTHGNDLGGRVHEAVRRRAKANLVNLVRVARTGAVGGGARNVCELHKQRKKRKAEKEVSEASRVGRGRTERRRSARAGRNRVIEKRILTKRGRNDKKGSHSRGLLRDCKSEREKTGREERSGGIGFVVLVSLAHVTRAGFVSAICARARAYYFASPLIHLFPTLATGCRSFVGPLRKLVVRLHICDAFCRFFRTRNNHELFVASSSLVR